MTEDCLKMYKATYCTKYHQRNSTVDANKYIAATSLNDAIRIAQEILTEEFGKAPTFKTSTDIRYQIEYEVTQTLVPPNEGIASTTIWALIQSNKMPQWTTALEMVVPQPRIRVYLNATETHYVPLRYEPGEMIEDKERALFLAIMRGEKPWIEQEQQNCVQHNLLEVNQLEQAA